MAQVNTWHKERGQSHYGTNHQMGCRITPAASAAEHPILTGVQQIHACSGGYKSQPPVGATPLLKLQVLNLFGPGDDINAEKSIVSAGWTLDSYTAPSGKKQDARIVYTPFGASEDLLDEDARRFMVNACLWAGSWEKAIRADLKVSVVGNFKPSPYTTGALYNDNVKPSELAGVDSQVMPPAAKLGRLTAPKMKKTVSRSLQFHPYLRAEIEAAYPDIYGRDPKRPTAKKPKKK